MGHARVAPSALHLTLACQASLQLQERVPPVPETEDEVKGTASHVVALAHAMGMGDIWIEGHEFESSGRKWKVTKDMLAGAQLYARTVGVHSHNRLEDGVKITVLHATDCYGTPDMWRYFQAGQYVPLPTGTFTTTAPVVRVVDYKSGHRYVDVFENPQLIGYGLGVLERVDLDDNEAILEIVIVQPFNWSAEPVRVWRIRFVDLRPLINQMTYKIAIALGDSPTATTGSHCMDCKARHMCATLREATTAIVEFSGTASTHELDIVAMAQELRILTDAIKQLAARETGLAAQLDSDLRAGKPVPHWTLKPTRSSLTWNTDENPTDLALKMEMLGINIRKPPEVMTPTQAIDSGIDASIIGDYAHKPTPALKLVPDKSSEVRRYFHGSSLK